MTSPEAGEPGRELALNCGQRFPCIAYGRVLGVLAGVGWSTPETEALDVKTGTIVMIINADKSSVDVAADARSILVVHAPDPDGLCRGWFEFASALARFPCSQARWAHAVLAGGERS